MSYLKGLKNLPKTLRRTEKIGVVSLVILAIAVGFAWWQTSYAKSIQPVKGGVYSEGVVAATTQDIDHIIDKLTQIGLTYVDHKGQTKGALADRWEISADGKQYTFYLRPGVDAETVADVYSSLPNWQNITINADGTDKIVMTLKQPFGLLLSFTSDPVVQAGPYQVEKQTKAEVIFTANSSFALGEPNLQRIIITFYPDEKLLKAALQRQEINAADIAIKGVSGTSIKSLTLTKQVALLFNIDKPIFKDKAIREKIATGQKLDQPLNVTLVTTQEEDLLKIANEFAEKTKKQNLNVSVKSVNQIVLDRDIVPNDQYDMIVTPLNYGYDQDPYPYWHSSQVIEDGKNYAGYINKETDKLIEEARQTIDQAQREEKYKQFYSALEKDYPGILYPNQKFEYTISKRIKGVTDGSGAIPTDRYTEIWKWYLKAKRVHSN
jgi:ABC-type transport system substrate-binding protein